MIYLWIGLGLLALLLVWAGVTDLRARRRGVRYRGVGEPELNALDRAEFEMRTRANNKFPGSGF
jgi:hypothetical protein